MIRLNRQQRFFYLASSSNYKIKHNNNQGKEWCHCNPTIFTIVLDSSLFPLHFSLYEEISNRIFHFSLFTFPFNEEISNRIFHFSLFTFPLDRRSAVVVAIVLPCTDGYVHAAAGLIKRYGKGVAFAALEGEGFGQIEVAPIHVHGDGEKRERRRTAAFLHS